MQREKKAEAVIRSCPYKFFQKWCDPELTG